MARSSFLYPEYFSDPTYVHPDHEVTFADFMPPGDYNIWELATEPKPELLYQVMRGIADDPDLLAKAVESMQENKIGFNVLYMAAIHDRRTKRKLGSLQLNLYNEEQDGVEHPHGHTRDAWTTWYALPDTIQEIERLAVAPDNARPIGGNVEERQMVAIHSVNAADGRRPKYKLTEFGEDETRLVESRSSTNVVMLGSQWFSPREVHVVRLKGRGVEKSRVAGSTHFKGAEEDDAFSRHTGLVDYKSLTPEQAERVCADHERLAQEVPEGLLDAAVSMSYPPLGETIKQVEANPTHPKFAVKLLEGMVDTLGRVATIAA